MKVRFYKTGLTKSLFLFAFGLLSSVAYSQTVTSVTATPNTGSFNQGDIITITINFSAAVDIDATKSIALTLETGATDAVLTYGGADQLNVTSMQLTYTVGATHTSGDLNYESTGSLALAADAIEVAGGTTDITATLPGLAAAESLGGSASIIIDTTNPASPSVPDLANGSDSGTSNSDNNTNINTPTVTGTAEDGSTVTITSSVNGVVGTGPATGGNYSIALSVLNEGAHNLTAVATDAAGNPSTASAALAITIDTGAPATPGLPNLDNADDTGSSDTDNVTKNIAAQTFTGTTDPNAAVEIFNGAVSLGTTTASGAGAWSIDLALTSGTYAINVIVKDVAGNTSAASPDLAFVVDDVAPATPSIPDLTAGTDSGSSDSDNLTNNATPTVSGTAEADALITITSDINAVVGTGTATGGNYSIGVSALNETTHALTAVATDLAGNSSAATTALTITIDVTAPAAPGTPDLDATSDSGSSSSDNYTNDNTPLITGTGDNGTTVFLSSNVIGALGSIAVSGGTYSITSALLTSVAHTITAVATDAAGNTSGSSAALNMTVDTSAPAVPTALDLDLLDDTGSSNTDNITKNTTGLTISGSSDANVSIELFRAGPTSLGTTTASGAGAWTLDISLLTETTHSVTAIATDQAGNTSAASSALAIQIDVTAPTTPPAAPNLDALSDMGVSSTDNLTNDATPNFTFTNVAGVANLRLNIYSSINGLVGFTTADGSGGVGGGGSTVTLTTDGVHTMTAKAADVAGNESAASASLNVTLDRVAPTIVFPVVFNYNTNNRETMVISFSETIGLVNGVTVANSDPAGRQGFYASEGDIRDNGSLFNSGTNQVTLQSVADGQWSAGDATPTQITYTSTSGSLTPADSDPNNLIRDLAGNEMATVNFVANDGGPPALATGFRFFPNGALAETVVVQVDESLILAEGAAVTGFTTTQGVPASAIYSGKGTTNTITFTSPGPGLWTESILFTYTQASGNVTDPSSNEMLAFSNAPIRLINVSIASNNTNGFTQKAKTGDLITLGFTANGTLTPAPTATIGGVAATIGGGPTNYTATLVAPIGLTEGILPIQIIAETAADSTTVSATTNDSQIVFDKTSPVISAVAIASTNVNTALAKPSDDVSVTFTVNELLAVAPTVTIAGRAASVSQIGLNYTATITMNGTDPEGAIAFLISLQDQVGNVSTASTTNNASSVTYDRTLPTISSIVVPPFPGNLALNNIGTSNGTTSTTVTYTVTFDSNVSGVDATDFTFTPLGDVSPIDAYPPVTGTISPIVMGGPQIYTVTINSISGTGRLRLNFVSDGSVTDASGNTNTTGFTTGQTYSIVLPQPPVHATGFSAVTVAPTTSSVQLDWTLPFFVFQNPTHYLIRVKGPDNAENPGTFPLANDGTFVNNDLNFADGSGAVTVSATTSTFTFTTLLSGKDYDFEIIPYNLSPNTTNDNVNFLNTLIPAASASTTSAAVGRFTPVNIAPATIPSTTTSFSTDVNFSFQVTDDGINPADDNSKTRFSQFLIQPSGGTITNLANVIEEAQLSDSEGNTVTASGSNIQPSYILFATPTTNDAIGEIDDNETKTYSLRIRLKSTLLNGADQTTDNKRFEFIVGSNSFDYLPGSSEILPGQTVNSDPSNANLNNTVTVDATALNFMTQPQASPYVLVGLAPVPTLQAQDVNGNRDLDYAETVTVSNAGSIEMLGLDLSPANSLVAAAGVISFPSDFMYNDDGNGTLTVTDGALTSAASSAVTVVYSNTSTITGPVVSNQNLQSTLTGLYSAIPLQFTINEDNNSAASDLAPTLISQILITQGLGNTVTNWSDVLAGAMLWDGNGPPYTHGVVGTDNITFSGLDVNTNGYVLGAIGDNASKTYYLYIWFKTAMGAAKTTVDNKSFVFELSATPSNILYNKGSKINPTEKRTSGLNTVRVSPTKVKWIANPAPELLVNKDISLQLPKPVVEITDVNDNRDLDYVTGLNITNAGGLSMTAGGAPVTVLPLTADGVSPSGGGLFTFPDNFQFEAIGNGQMTATATGISAPNVNTALGTPVTVRVAKSSTITAGGGAEPATISSLATTIPGTQVFDFTINDDAGAENDGNATQITSITITRGGTDEVYNKSANGWKDAIASARLTDCADPTLPGCTTTVVASSITASSIVFNLTSPLGQVADNGSKTYKLLISLDPTMEGTMPSLIDGLNFEFEIDEDNVVVDANGTGFIDDEVENSGAGNEVTVAVTELNFSRLDITDNFKVPYADANFPVSGSINTLFAPRLGVEASDANGNRDLGFTGTITAFSIASGLTHINGPAVSTDVFANGVYKLPANFQYTSGNNQSGILTMTAGGITSSSPAITISSSFESWITGADRYDNTYSIPTTINYAYHQATNIQNDANSHELIRLALSDGDAEYEQSPIAPPAGSPTDDDGANTVMTSFTLGVNNFKAVRRIAIYDGVGATATEIQELDQTDFANISGSYATITFTSLNIVAPDNDRKFFSIRASFFNDAATITDNVPVQLSFVSAVLGGGSGFYNVPPGIGPYIVGNPPSEVVAPATFNVLEVTATKFDFTTQHAVSGYAGINEPVPAGVLRANDQNGLRDLDFSNPVTLSSPTAGLNYTSANFASGELTLTGLRYTSAGSGKITVSYNSGTITSNLASPVNGLPNNAVTGQAINVYHVNALANTTGVVAATNIKGGSANVVVFGVTFHSDYNAASHPKLNGFTINFDNPYKTSGKDIFKNIRIFKSTVGSFAGATNITISDPGSTITQNNSNAIPVTTLDQITVAFQAGSEPVLTTDLTFYLVVDVDATANISTPKLTPRLVDAGFGSLTNNNILTTRGSATGNVIGKQYSFATTRPPALVKSFPFNGQLNVDPNQDTISLVFDVGVWSFDSVAQLYDRYSNNLIATLQAKNGRFAGLLNPATEQVTDTLTFVIPPSALPLKPDSVYYLTIAKGTFNPGTQKGTGIADDGLNLYGGISYNGTVYFKVAGTKPPAMTGTNKGTVDNPKYYITEQGGALNAIFDQFGKAYFMVVDEGDPAPTNQQIRDKNDLTYTGTVHARDTIEIKQISKPQYGSFDAALNSGTTYDVWIYAENDALPTPFPTSAPFGSINEFYAVGGVEPTLKIEVNVAPGDLYVNEPIYQICANSNSILADPIIIAEGLDDDFTHGMRQDFNILLPPGFQFDMSNKPEILLSGPDFSMAVPSNPGELEVTYFNNTLLNVSFVNTESDGLDKITISGIKVIATSSDLSGRIRRFAGSAILPALPDGTTLARIISQATEPLSFDNSYNLSNDFSALPIEIFNTVSYIPDNFVDTNKQPVVRLFPNIPKGDYGPSQFSGAGVTNDLLSLTGVQLNSAFDITMTHTDMNGCVSTKVEQYTVYDHTEAISVLGTDVCAPNNNFPGAAPSLLSPQTVGWNDLAGYSLISLTAKIPDQKNNTDFVMNGLAWDALVSQIPVASPTGTEQLGFMSYKWDYSVLLNAVTESGNVITASPYERFRATEKGQTYYNGGSIGFVEFTGKYRSNADNTVFIPVRQEVQVFVPARPIILVSGQSSNAGTTPIFCENDPDIQFEGFPRAIAGKSSGTFRVYDSLGALLSPQPPVSNPLLPPVHIAGFADAGNGTATLDPSVFAHNFKTLRIEYEYDDFESPCPAFGNLYVRVTPNPTPNFTTSSYLCAGTDITFNSGALIPAPFKLDSIGWNFGDQNAPAELNTSDLDTAQHKFVADGNYIVNFAAYSNYGCKSNTFTRPITVGAVPEVDFDFAGLSTADKITFRSKSTVSGPNPLAPASPVQRLDWNFGDGIKLRSFRNDSTQSHQYGTPNVFPVSLTITSTVGCKDTLYKNVIVVNKVVTTDLLSREENFNTDQAGWQQWNLADSSKRESASWKWGVADGPVIQGTTNAWTTSSITTTGVSSYQPNEKSALFSSVYDISALARPMVSFNSFVQTMQSDGVVLEFSTDSLNLADPSKKWTALGSLDQATNISTGVDWFNKGNLASKPGQQDLGNFGWSESVDPDGDNVQEWIESKHSLGAIIENNDRLVFRFALGSVNSNPQVDGFAVDNFRIGNRTRIVLLENFRNLGNPATDARGVIEKVESDSINAFNPSGVATSIVRINYHVAFPNKDPFNLDNNQDPGARALYYNISQTPRARMDGQFPSGATLFSGWGENFYNIRSLKLADAIIKPVVSNSADGSGSVSIEITALKDLGPETILNVALVERSIAKSNLSTINQGFVQTGETQFDYVLKKLVPNASGTRFGTLLAQNQTRTFSEGLNWTRSFPLYGASDSLTLVIFLQNENTKEIYQSEIVKVKDPSIVTGIEDLNAVFNVYPNPADQEMTIELPANITEGATMRMFDQVGKVVNNASFEKGERTKTINTSTHAGGVYLIQVETSKGILTRKVMVLHSR